MDVRSSYLTRNVLICSANDPLVTSLRLGSGQGAFCLTVCRWGTRNDPQLISRTLLVARPVDPRGQAEASDLVAVDTVDVGVGESVLIVSGSSVRMAVEPLTQAALQASSDRGMHTPCSVTSYQRKRVGAIPAKFIVCSSWSVPAEQDIVFCRRRASYGDASDASFAG